MTRKLLAIIPARGGSKGFRRKNIAPLMGKPLVAWTIEAAKAAENVSTVVVTSDDEEILSIASSFGAETLFRPTSLSTDEAAMMPVIEHTLTSYLEKNYSYECFCLLQPTSPLRTSTHIDEAYLAMKLRESDSTISVVKRSNTALKWFVDSSGRLAGLVNDEYPFARRQDLPAVCSANGAIYIMNSKEFLSCGKLLTPNTIPYYMDAKNSIDIDTADDLQKVEMAMMDFLA